MMARVGKRIGNRYFLGALAAVVAAAIGFGAWQLLKPEPTFDEFLDDAFAEMLERDRMLRWMAGDPVNFGLDPDPEGGLIDLSPQAWEAHMAMVRRQSDELNAYDPARLDEDDRLTFELLRDGYDASLEGERYRQLAAGDSLLALLVFPANYTSYNPVTDKPSAQRYTNNLLAFPELVNGLMESLDSRRAAGIPYPRPFLDYGLRELGALVYDDPRDDPLYLHFLEWLDESNGNVADEQRMADELREVLQTAVYPSVEHLRKYMRDHLLPEASDDASLSSYPGGRDYYAYLVRQMTGTKLTPDEAHELAAKRAEEMNEAIQSLPAEEWIAFAGIGRSLVQTEEAIGLMTELQAEMDAVLPLAFEDTLLPQADVHYRMTDFPDSLYRAVSIDDSRDAFVLVSKDQRWDRPTFANLTFHEGSPGHHLQVAIQYKSERIPNIRKAGFHPGFAEGWAVYADSTVAEELGMHDAPGSKFAQLAYLRYRFASIALDTGIHWLGWTQEEADRFMLDIGMGSRVPMDYFAAYPGLALPYGIGYERFTALRARAEAELGEAFGVREFHTAVLENGSMPFDLLERQVDRYIEREQAEG